MQTHDLTIMKKKITLIYFSLVGWFGVLLALVMPLLIFSTTDDIYKDPLFFPLWILGGALSLVMGATMLIYRRKKIFSKIGLFFVVVGLISLCGAGYVYLQDDTYSEPLLMEQPKIPGATDN
jgi:amino acid transporter